MTDLKMTDLFNNVIQELNNGVFNHTYIKRVFNTKFTILERGRCRLKPNQKSRNELLCGGSFGNKFRYYFHTCFGNVYLDYNTFEIVNDRYKDKMWIFPKNGIEVLGMIPNRTKDGKYCYDGGKSIKELRECCKMNGLKGYSNKDKAGIIQLLMKI